jgi:NAD(P)-dependent dehydrogenase (short-subunit alcohol dehydrogenase family)
MIENGYGRVVNITSSVQTRLETMAYACSKAALDKFVHDLAPSIAGTGVMLTLADPGWLRTDMTSFIGPNSVESVIPGVLLGAVLDGDINGRWFSVQDYAGLSIETAIEKAKFVSTSSLMHVQRIQLQSSSMEAQ